MDRDDRVVVEKAYGYAHRGWEIPNAADTRFGVARATDVVQLEGMDAGVSFLSKRDPGTRTTCTVISNTSDGAWPVARVLDAHVAI